MSMTDNDLCRGSGGGTENTMKKVNYHTHTRLCRHAGGTEEDYVKRAAAEKLDILGFSDHAPYPDGRYGLRMDYAELKPHLKRIGELKAEYAGRLEIRTGLEIEYDRQDSAYYETLLGEMGVEYLLLGQHFFKNGDGERMNTFLLEESRNTENLLYYAESVVEAMQSGYFKAIAHPDVFFINDLPIDRNCERACEMIVEGAADAKAVLEFNANGIRRGKRSYADGARWPYPHRMFWELAAQARITAVISSDCHNPENLWDTAMEEAYETARKWGLRLTDRLFETDK